MAPAMNTSRALCPRCELPLSACLCRWIAPLDNRLPLLILQHPMERQQAKGSARLLGLSLRNCRIWVGERFDEAALQQALHGDGQGHTLLLYPESAGPEGAPRAAAEGPAGLLVVLDATWRKSRKMLLLNPLLQTLPRLALQDPPPSRYAIRKAQQAHQRSTLEASVLALRQLEGAEAPGCQALLASFDGFVGQQAKRAAGQT